MNSDGRKDIAWQLALEPVDYVPPVVAVPTLLTIFGVIPVAAPRMTKFDGIRIAKWRANGREKLRPGVKAYVLFQDALCKAVLADVHHDRFKLRDLMSCVGLRLYFPIPPSWSNKKRQLFLGAPMEQKPDKDNCEKAFYDSLFEADSQVWDNRVQKRWEDENGPRIEVWRLPPWG